MPEGTTEKGIWLNTEPGETLDDKQKEIKGVWEAVHFVDKISKDKKGYIDQPAILMIQSKVMGHFHPEVQGKYRDFDVEVRGAGFLPTHHKSIREEMLVFGRELSERTSNLDHSLNGMDEVVKAAAWAHYRLVRIHPFAEGNGRTARLLVDLIAKKSGMYYISDWGDRNQYLDSLKVVDQTGDLSIFERYLARRFAARYEQVSYKMLKGKFVKQESGRTIFADLLTRKQMLLSMAA